MFIDSEFIMGAYRNFINNTDVNTKEKAIENRAADRPVDFIAGYSFAPAAGLRLAVCQLKGRILNT